MTTKTKTTKNKILSFLLTEVIFAVVALGLSALIWSQIVIKYVRVDGSFMTAPGLYITMAVIVGIFNLIYLYIVFKTNMFGMSKTINRVDRAEADTFGNSRWQTNDEMHRNYGRYDFDKLAEVETEGYVIKSEVKGGKLLVSTVAEQHNLVVGTTGTGKSAFYLSLTIQMNAKTKTKSSMVINDLKGELYSQHSKFLKEQGYNVIKIDLRMPHLSDRYNPLSLIWDLYHDYHNNGKNNPELISRVAVYINEIASVLCPVGTGDQQQWSKGAQSIIKSVIWGILEDSLCPEYNITKDMLTILQISNIVNRQKANLDDFLKNRNKLSPVFDYAGMILDNPSEKTVGSYYATLSTALEGFLEEGLKRVTAATDIDITKLATEPTALFIIIPDELKTRNIVGTMIVSQIYNYLTFEASNNKPTERLAKNVYFLLDEFGNLPIIPNFPSWVSLSRSRGIYFNLIIQADSQLEEVYNKNGAKTIMQNCHLQMLLGANEIDTLKRFEDLFGKYTIYQRSANIDQQSSISEYKGSTGLTSKELITLDQLQRIQRGTAYFKILRQFPCKTVLAPYFLPEVQKHLTIGKLETGDSERPAVDYKNTYYDLALRQAYIDEFLRNLSPFVPAGGGGKKNDANSDDNIIPNKIKKKGDGSPKPIKEIVLGEEENVENGLIPNSKTKNNYRTKMIDLINK